MKTSIVIHHRRSSRGKEYGGSLFARVIRRGKGRSVSLKCHLLQAEWDLAGQCIRWDSVSPLRREYVLRAEQELIRATALLWQIHDQLEEKGDFTAADIVGRFRLKESGGKLFPFARKLCEELEGEGHVSSARSCRTAIRRLEEFTGKPQLTFRELTPELLLGFEKKLRQEGLCRNTTSSYMRALRAMQGKAVVRGFAEAPAQCPFAGVFTGVEQTPKRALTPEELRQLAGWKPASELAEEKIVRARDLFLFAFFAQGMSFVDMAFLKKEDIEGDVITYYRHKTGQRVKVVLTPEALRIIASFAEETAGSPYVFPVIRRPGENERLQYESGLRLQNKHLKALALKTQLSTHMSRHSWSTMARQQGLPIALISECLGHSSEKTTRIYLGAFDKETIAEANRKIIRSIY